MKKGSVSEILRRVSQRIGKHLYSLAGSEMLDKMGFNIKTTSPRGSLRTDLRLLTPTPSKLDQASRESRF